MRVLYLQIAVGIIAIIGLFGSILPFLISARSNELFIFGVAVLVIFPILFALDYWDCQKSNQRIHQISTKKGK